jgi:hypothetical protein
MAAGVQSENLCRPDCDALRSDLSLGRFEDGWLDDGPTYPLGDGSSAIIRAGGRQVSAEFINRVTYNAPSANAVGSSTGAMRLARKHTQTFAETAAFTRSILCQIDADYFNLHPWTLLCCSVRMVEITILAHL